MCDIIICLVIQMFFLITQGGRGGTCLLYLEELPDGGGGCAQKVSRLAFGVFWCVGVGVGVWVWVFFHSFSGWWFSGLLLHTGEIGVGI